jgi:hypothetical protein
MTGTTILAAFSQDFPMPLSVGLPVIAVVGAVVLFFMRKRK